MLWINRADAPQLRQKLVCDHGWPMVLHAVDDAVCDSRDGIKSVLPLQEAMRMPGASAWSGAAMDATQSVAEVP